MRRLFIANRGEIARRIATTATRLGIEPVLPPLDGPGAVDLLDPAAVAAAAQRAGADAVHPGYGFLAESPDLAVAEHLHLDVARIADELLEQEPLITERPPGLAPRRRQRRAQHALRRHH
ncbi:MAG TPA: biotin carboxylase N-terminal domain-containing protein, partial [Candidatus Limnocylindrales bacterium]